MPIKRFYISVGARWVQLDTIIKLHTNSGDRFWQIRAMEARIAGEYLFDRALDAEGVAACGSRAHVQIAYVRVSE
jgi:hypothetical protein